MAGAEGPLRDELPEGMVRNSEGYIVPKPHWWDGWPDDEEIKAKRHIREQEWKAGLRQRAKARAESDILEAAQREQREISARSLAVARRFIMESLYGPEN